MRITGSNRLAVPEIHWAERPVRKLAPRLSLLILMVVVLVGGGILSLRAHAAPTAAPPTQKDPEGGLFLRR